MSEAELNEKVDIYFGVKDDELRLVAQTLARSGFEWADIRRLMFRVWGVAWNEGNVDGYDDGYSEGYVEGLAAGSGGCE